jgi:hypothetical protein
MEGPFLIGVIVKNILWMLALVFGLLAQSAIAEAPAMVVVQGLLTQAGNAEAPPKVRSADELLKVLVDDGSLSVKSAEKARAQYHVTTEPVVAAAVAANPEVTPKSESSNGDLLGAMLKVFGVLLLIAMFWQVIVLVLAGIGELFAHIPQRLLSVFVAAPLLVGLLRPELVWASQAEYVAMFCALTVLPALTWVAVAYFGEDRIQRVITRAMERWALPELLMAIGACYVGYFAHAFNSKLMGFIAVMLLTGLTSFQVRIWPGVVSLGVRKMRLLQAVFGNLAILGVFLAIRYYGLYPVWADVFTAGFQYFNSLALAVALSIGATLFFRKEGEKSHLWYLACFFVVTLGAMGAYALMGEHVIGITLCGFFALTLFEWLSYYAFRAHFILGAALCGSLLYVGGMLIEQGIIPLKTVAMNFG